MEVEFIDEDELIICGSDEILLRPFLIKAGIDPLPGCLLCVPAGIACPENLYTRRDRCCEDMTELLVMR